MLWQLKLVCKWTHVWCDSRSGDIQPHNNTTKIEMKLQTQLLGPLHRVSHVTALRRRCVFLFCHFYRGYKKTPLVYPPPPLAPFLGAGGLWAVSQCIHILLSSLVSSYISSVGGLGLAEDVTCTYLRCWPTCGLAAVAGRGFPAYFKGRAPPTEVDATPL